MVPAAGLLGIYREWLLLPGLLPLDFLEFCRYYLDEVFDGVIPVVKQSGGKRRASVTVMGGDKTVKFCFSSSYLGEHLLTAERLTVGLQRMQSIFSPSAAQWK